MLSRAAFLACLCLAAPASAAAPDETVRPAGPTSSLSDRVVRVLPPARPDQGAGTAADAAPETPSIDGAVVSGNAEGAAALEPTVAILPPLRPAYHGEEIAGGASSLAMLPPERPAADAPAEGILVAVMPPARPAFHADPPAVLDVAALDDLDRAALPPPRPVSLGDAEPARVGSSSEVAAPSRSLFDGGFGAAALAAIAPVIGLPAPKVASGHPEIDRMIARHARLNDVPEDLVHRVVIRESKYNPRAVGQGGALGLMQIKHATARGLGYGGTAAGLLDAETNITYAVKYLAGAYRVASGNYDGAVRNYARGYYYEAKRKGLIQVADRRDRRRALRREADASVAIDREASDTASMR